MAYIEVLFGLIADADLQEILTAELAEIGFESFMEDETFFRAYCPEESFSDYKLAEILAQESFENIPKPSKKLIPDENWNANWESSYNDVVIDDSCRIRAPFHKPNLNIKFDLLIEPKMSFGTAHHETTAQMISLMLKADFEQKSVLDMGCGTAVLAVLACKMGAQHIVAIDNDSWAYENALENVKLNNCEGIKVIKGDASAIGNQKFEVILANINRNILLADMQLYAQAMPAGAKLFLSGFYVEDLPEIRKSAEKLAIHYQTHTVKNNWVAAEFSKS
ncbi:MAG: 50S ribosomal protein L11 methyltransferase [Bacteroidales bacterium]|jgi:ribosomal protein L11 methyltransferase|nr:50S ribosomal protein L11 methyltransferase [Bacteroidales bacterium]